MKYHTEDIKTLLVSDTGTSFLTEAAQVHAWSVSDIVVVISLLTYSISNVD